MKRIEFGELVIGDIARENLMHVCDTNWASGGPKVKQTLTIVTHIVAKRMDDSIAGL